MSVDGVAAARTLLRYRNIRHGYCLYYVWQAYKAHGARTGMSSPTAYDAWRKSSGKHPGDRNPPAGVPVFWGPKPGSAAGDVVISLGGGRVVATDYPVYGQVNITTIAARERQIGRPYLGWTERIFDVPISFKANSGGSSSVSQDTKNRQSWLNKSRGEKLAVDGIQGSATTAAIKRYQTFLKRSYGYKGAVDGIWGNGTQTAHQRYYDAWHKPKPSGSMGGTLSGLKWTGIQRMLKSDFGYSGAIDNIPGAGSIRAFQRFMNAKGYGKRAGVGNLTVDGIAGPATLKAAQRWLKETGRYSGAVDGIRGAGTNAGWARAEAENGRAYSRIS